MTYLYVFSSRTTTKIGISGNAPERLADIKRHDRSARLFFCCRLENAKNSERILHAHYHRYRRIRPNCSGGTEWFAIHPLRPAFWLLYWRIGELIYKSLQILAIIIFTILATIICFGQYN